MKLTHVIAISVATLGLLAISRMSPSTEPAPPVSSSSAVIAIGCPVSFDCDGPSGDVLGTFGTVGACRTFCAPRGGICERVIC